MVSVDVIIGTYNHEEFVGDAIESALAQRYDFDVMIYITDDGSKDKTQEIIRRYYRMYPDRIIPFLDTENRGFRSRDRLFLKVLESSKADYIAFLEGDDCWTDPYKLQKQVEFMEAHPDCSISSHPVRVVYTGCRKRLWRDVYGINEKRFYTMEEFLGGEGFPEVPTPGVMIRNSCLPPVPQWFCDVVRGDTVLHLLLLHCGRLGFLEDCMAVHRKHDQGVSRLFDTDPEFMQFDILKIYLYMDRHFEYRYHRFFKRHMKDVVEHLLHKEDLSHKTVKDILDFCSGLPEKDRYWDVISPLAMRLKKEEDYTYIFEHIPKTGGTTFLFSYVDWAFDEKDRFIIPGTEPENGREIDRLIRNRKNYLIIGGHNTHRVREVYPDAKYITLVREPVSRIISLYLHLKYHPGVKQKYRVEEGTSLSRFIEERLNLPMSRVSNYQARFLSYPGPFSLNRIFDRYHLIGITERLDEFIFALHVMDNFPLLLFTNRMVRKERKDFKLTEEERELIVRYNQDDILLYEEARRRFDRTIEEVKASGFGTLLTDYKKALKGFQKLNGNINRTIPYRPGDGRAALLLEEGEEAFERGDIERAIKLFLEVIDMEPSSPFAGAAYNNIGVACCQMGEVKDALHHFTRALQVDPGNPTIMMNTCKFLRGIGKGEDAERLYAAYLKMTGGSL